MADAHCKVAVNRKVVPLQDIANQTGEYQSSLRGGRILVFVARFQRDSRIGTHLYPFQKRFLALAETSSIAMPSSASSASTSPAFHESPDTQGQTLHTSGVASHPLRCNCSRNGV